MEAANGKKIEAFSVFGADGMGEADLIHPYDVVGNKFDYNVTLVTDVDKENYFNLYRDIIKG